MEKEKNTKLFVTLLITIIILLIIVGIFLITKSIHHTSNVNPNNTNQSTTEEEKEPEPTTLTEKEAITTGKELYDKVTEAYDVWKLYPYCGINMNDINNQQTIKLDDAGVGEGNATYYYSGYKNLDELKNSLKKYLSEDIINSKITKSAVTDTSSLKNITYNDYVELDGKLYCRNFGGKGFLTRYTGEYEINPQKIEENKITYTVTLKHITERAQQDGACDIENTSKCATNDFEYNDTTFEIEKVNNNWVVTNYVEHN